MESARKIRSLRTRSAREKTQAKLQASRSDAFEGASHASGIVIERIGIEAKQPNSAIRKCVRVRLIKNGKTVTAFVPGDGSLNFIQENDKVLLAGLGRRGRAVGDLPAVHYQVIKVGNQSLKSLAKSA